MFLQFPVYILRLKPDSWTSAGILVQMLIHVYRNTIAGNLQGEQFSIFADDYLTVKLSPQNKLNCTAHSGNGCEDEYL